MPNLQREELEDFRSEVVIQAGGAQLQGEITVPAASRGLVVFSHGSGSGRRSPRNRFVASALHNVRLATLLLDLLTPKEDAAVENRFDIALLTERLMETVFWTRVSPELKGLPIGLFGASTGAASALETAANLGGDVRAVVCRGGRPDLAGSCLCRVVSPTRFIVGGEDSILPLNERALSSLGAEAKELQIIPGATHLFEERGALEEVARLSSEWFQRYL